MGLLDKIFPGNKNKIETMATEYFKALTMYTPSFTSYHGSLYEMDLTRAAIHTYAKHCAKLKPEIQGNAYKSLEKTLQFKPNPFMDTYKFLYRLATSLKVENTAFIVPLYGDDGMTITGLYPLRAESVEVVESSSQLWLRYSFANGQRAAIEFDKVGILTNHQYEDDFFGSSNQAINPTMELLNIQNQGMQEAIKQSAVIRFMAKLGQNIRPEDIEKERLQFSKQNLSEDNKTGVMMFDAKYSEVKQIDSKPFVVDDKQMAIINNNVYNYTGTNEAIIQNKYTEDQFNAFYEGEIEVFALQVSLVITNMLFTTKELAFNNNVHLTANRLQYASNTTKLNVCTEMYDRGLFSMNQVMDVFNLSHVPNGDNRRVRGEYVDIDDEGRKILKNEPLKEKEVEVKEVDEDET